MRPEHGGQLRGSRHRSAGDGVWLDFSVNLNPYAPQPADSEWLAWRDDIAKYPAPTSRSVDQLLESYLGVSESGWVISTQGAMEALKLALGFQGGRTIHIPVPCFSEYVFLCEQLGLDYRTHVISERGWINGRSWLNMEVDQGGAVLFGNPNNPFGVSVSIEDLLPILCHFRENNVMVIVDEAFIEFTKTPQEYSLISILKDFPNVMIAGSLTKSWSIPGIRLGYLVSADCQSIEILRNRQITWPLNSIVHGWATSMLVEARVAGQRAGMRRLQETKEQLFASLQGFSFLRVYPSDANYRVCECLFQMDEMIGFLGSQQIGVRLCDSIPGLPAGRFIRIGAGLPEHNRRLIQALTAFASLIAEESHRKAE